MDEANYPWPNLSWTLFVKDVSASFMVNSYHIKSIAQLFLYFILTPHIFQFIFLFLQKKLYRCDMQASEVRCS